MNILCNDCGFKWEVQCGQPRDEQCPRCRVRQYEKWVADLQSGMFINCVFCGHRYGPRPDTPVAMADVLKAHIETCPDHPLSRARSEIARLRAKVTELREEVKYWQLKGMRR